MVYVGVIRAVGGYVGLNEGVGCLSLGLRVSLARRLKML